MSSVADGASTVIAFVIAGGDIVIPADAETTVIPFPPIINELPSVSRVKLPESPELNVVAPLNVEPEIVATTLSFTANVTVLPAPASVSLMPVPAVIALSFGKDAVVLITTYVAA